MILLQTKLKNAVKRHSGNMELEFRLKTILLNGRKLGCTGFIKNTRNGSIVYVNTEQSCMSQFSYLYRYADDFNDYRGYQNRFGKTLEEYAAGICKCLRTTPQLAGDKRM